MDNTTIGGRPVAQHNDARQAPGELVAAVLAHTVSLRLQAQKLPKEIADAGLDAARRGVVGQTIEQAIRQATADLGSFAALTAGAHEAPQVHAAQLQRLTAALGPVVGRLPQASPASVQALWQLQPALMHALQEQCRASGLGASRGVPPGATQGLMTGAQDRLQAQGHLPEGHAAAPPQGRPAGLQAPKMMVQFLVSPPPPPEPPTLRVGLRNVRLTKTKVKYAPRLYRHLKLGTHTFAKIYLGDGRFFTMAATIARGAFGKIRPAVDAQGQPVAVKVIRHESKRGSDKLGQSKTKPQPQEEVYRELALTTQLRGIVDPAVAQVPLLQTVRRGYTPFILWGVKPGPSGPGYEPHGRSPFIPVSSGTRCIDGSPSEAV